MQGILFIEPLFHLTRRGLKTETRRTGNLNKIINKNPNDYILTCIPTHCAGARFMHIDTKQFIEVKPRYKVGEIVFCKEPYQNVYYKDEGGNLQILENNFVYKFSAVEWEIKFKNKLFMPQAAARYHIKITGVTVERIKRMTNAAAVAEGLIELKKSKEYGDLTFQELFEQINKKDGGAAFREDHWVFVYKYELYEPEKFKK